MCHASSAARIAAEHRALYRRHRRYSDSLHCPVRTPRSQAFVGFTKGTASGRASAAGRVKSGVRRRKAGDVSTIRCLSVLLAGNVPKVVHIPESFLRICLHASESRTVPPCARPVNQASLQHHSTPAEARARACFSPEIRASYFSQAASEKGTGLLAWVQGRPAA